jgi:hypothetical protein
VENPDAGSVNTARRIGAGCGAGDGTDGKTGDGAVGTDEGSLHPAVTKVSTSRIAAREILITPPDRSLLNLASLNVRARSINDQRRAERRIRPVRANARALL